MKKISIKRLKQHSMSKKQRLAELREIFAEIDADPILKEDIKKFIKITSQ